MRMWCAQYPVQVGDGPQALPSYRKENFTQYNPVRKREDMRHFFFSPTGRHSAAGTPPSGMQSGVARSMRAVTHPVKQGRRHLRL